MLLYYLKVLVYINAAITEVEMSFAQTTPEPGFVTGTSLWFFQLLVQSTKHHFILYKRRLVDQSAVNDCDGPSQMPPSPANMQLTFSHISSGFYRCDCVVELCFPSVNPPPCTNIMSVNLDHQRDQRSTLSLIF